MGRAFPIKIVLVVSVKIYYPGSREKIHELGCVWGRRRRNTSVAHTQLRYFHGDLSALLSYVIRSLGAIIMKIRKRRCNLCASTVN